MYLKSIMSLGSSCIEDVYANVKKVRVTTENQAYVMLDDDGVFLRALVRDKGSDDVHKSCGDISYTSCGEPLVFKDPPVKLTQDALLEQWKKDKTSLICCILNLYVDFEDGSHMVLNGYCGTFYLMDNTGKTISKY